MPTIGIMHLSDGLMGFGRGYNECKERVNSRRMQMLRKAINAVLGVFRIGRRSKGEMPVEEKAKAEPEESDTEPAGEDETPEEEPG